MVDFQIPAGPQPTTAAHDDGEWAMSDVPLQSQDLSRFLSQLFAPCTQSNAFEIGKAHLHAVGATLLCVSRCRHL